MDESTKLWDKSLDNLTVGDALKLNLVVMAGLVTIYGVAIGGVTGCMKLSAWNQQRKARKQLDES